MKKKWIISVSIVVAVIAFLLATGVIVIDHSAQRGFENSVTWRGCTYVVCSYSGYHEGRTLAKTTDGLRINAVKEDLPTHLSSFALFWINGCWYERITSSPPTAVLSFPDSKTRLTKSVSLVFCEMRSSAPPPRHSKQLTNRHGICKMLISVACNFHKKPYNILRMFPSASFCKATLLEDVRI